MAKVGAQRAAVLTGKSKSTIQRAMNSGKLSFELDANDRRVIDVSELERVFGIKQTAPEPERKTAAPPAQRAEISLEEALEKERLKMQIKMLEQQLATATERVDDLIDQRNKWEKQASQILITSQYSQRQAEELRAQIKEREERARKRRMQSAQIQSTHKPSSDVQVDPTKKLDQKMRRLQAENENMTEPDEEQNSVFKFWKKALN
ncbi:MAG: entry exclusion 1 domain-containing protein [Alphaproteobacteria bacterium]|nr:entry exclusion 1 domain-containing protein [Alphaproteobacteria bacterium]